MSFMKNFFGGKGKKKEEKEEGKTVRFRSVESSFDNGRNQSIAFADRTFGEENLSEYARSKGSRRRRTAQSLPGVNSDDTRSIGRGRDNRSVITPHHERHHIDISPERISYHLSRGQRRKRDYRSEIDLSLSDQENLNETRRRDEKNYVEKMLKKYKDQRNSAKEENRRLRDENDKLKKDNETLKNQLAMLAREKERYRGRMDSNNQWMVHPPFNGSLRPPGSFSSHHSSFYQMGTDSYSSRATSAASSSSTMNHNTNAGESLSMNSPVFLSSSLHTPQHPYS